MQIGVVNHPACDPVGEIEWIEKHGFDFVDFTLKPPAADPDHIDAESVRAALDRHGLGVVAHTAYYLPLASPFVACIKQGMRFWMSDSSVPNFSVFAQLVRLLLTVWKNVLDRNTIRHQKVAGQLAVAIVE